MSTVMTAPPTPKTPEAAPRSRSWRAPLVNLRDELEDLFSNFMTDAGAGWATDRLVPSIDLSETDNNLEVHMDLPGLKAADIDIQVHGNLLTVRGQRKEEKEEKGRTFHRMERRCGAFSRTVTLPCAIQDDKVDAHYQDGVLKILLPKTDECKSHKIKVKT